MPVVDQEATRQVRIVSNGFTRNTHVFVGDEELRHVTKIEWELDASTGLGKATLHLFDVALELETEMELVTHG
jgi:hypothetical protein